MRMSEALWAAEPMIRLGVFAGVFAALALWEVQAPRRQRIFARLQRWPANLGIVVLDTAAVRVLFPTAAIGTAILGEERGWGLLNNLEIPNWSAVALSVLVLDLA